MDIVRTVSLKTDFGTTYQNVTFQIIESHGLLQHFMCVKNDIIEKQGLHIFIKADNIINIRFSLYYFQNIILLLKYSAQTYRQFFVKIYIFLKCLTKHIFVFNRSLCLVSAGGPVLGQYICVKILRFEIVGFVIKKK